MSSVFEMMSCHLLRAPIALALLCCAALRLGVVSNGIRGQAQKADLKGRPLADNSTSHGWTDTMLRQKGWATDGS